MTWRPTLTPEQQIDQLYSRVFCTPDGSELLKRYEGCEAIPIEEIILRTGRARKLWDKGWSA